MPAWTLRKSFVIFLVVLNIAFIGVILWLAPKTVRVRVSKETSANGLPVLASAAPFELIRETGESFKLSDLAGKNWVADFVFTRCPNQCPTMSSRFALLQKKLPPNARLVSFSVDPSYDSPPVLQAYAQKFGADPQKWVFLTGDTAAISKIQSDLKLSAAGEDPGMHSLRFVLLDGKGNVRGYYDSEDAQALVQLSKDLSKLGAA